MITYLYFIRNISLPEGANQGQRLFRYLNHSDFSINYFHTHIPTMKDCINVLKETSESLLGKLYLKSPWFTTMDLEVFRVLFCTREMFRI